jgi:hypothetical protein
VANICDNKFLLSNEGNDEDFKKVKHRLMEEIGYNDEYFYGDITFEDDDVLEGYFESRWNFPEEKFREIIPDDLDVYFRCLSEEYGCSYVAMNVYSEGAWNNEQTFDF